MTFHLPYLDKKYLRNIHASVWRYWKGFRMTVIKVKNVGYLRVRGNFDTKFDLLSEIGDEFHYLFNYYLWLMSGNNVLSPKQIRFSNIITFKDITNSNKQSPPRKLRSFIINHSPRQFLNSVNTTRTLNCNMLSISILKHPFIWNTKFYIQLCNCDDIHFSSGDSRYWADISM